MTGAIFIEIGLLGSALELLQPRAAIIKSYGCVRFRQVEHVCRALRRSHTVEQSSVNNYSSKSRFEKGTGSAGFKAIVQPVLLVHYVNNLAGAARISGGEI